MSKRNAKSLIKESDVRRMKRLAGLIKDDSDMDDDLLTESSEIPGVAPSAPSGASAPKAGPESPVLQEVEEDEDLEEDDEEIGLEDDEPDGDEEFGGVADGSHEEPDGDEVGSLGGGMGAGSPDQKQIADALRVIGQACGITVEIEGDVGASAPVGDDMGTDLSEPGDEMGTQPPAEGESFDTGMPEETDEFGDNQDLSREQQKMLAEIFARTSKQIMDSIKKNKTNKKPVAKKK